MARRLPAEWEPQSGLLLTWPHAGTDWQDNLAQIEDVFVTITRHTARQQQVIIACHDLSVREHVETLLQDRSINENRYRTCIAPSNDTWSRDHGPVTVLDNDSPCLLDFVFNGWGNKYDADLDNRITQHLHAAGAFGDVPLRQENFVLEGGSIESDGQGTLLVTCSCLLSSQRNGNMNLSQVEARLVDFFGCTQVHWLEHGFLSGDDTDGHIDTLARFADPGTILYCATNDPGHPDYRSLNRMQEELAALKQGNGNPYRLLPLPTPAIIGENGMPLPASYANFLIINGAVLVPVYEVKEDHAALQVISSAFPEREITAINCRALIEQHGSLHCATMQLPSGVLS